MSNRLSQETSPYLKQHAGNPVDWHPWDDQALTLARAEQKPILLSIGYSSCHWCHVMAHESFEDAATAEVMNRHFVNIKVDREERPDLDRVYQLAHQLLTRQTGGWPLTMFLDPDTLLPFFGGTYFPRAPRYQLPGFVDLLLRIRQIFDEQRAELTGQGEKMRRILAELEPGAPGPGELGDVELLTLARDQLAAQYDRAEGGFGEAPKFPMPSTLERLLRHWARARDAGDADREALEMVMISLTRMARGGIFDHLGGGFCRYSVDRKWMIPHFEKMLYDNGQLLALYADALSIGPDELFETAVADTAGWLLREMRHPDGGFFAALDADSEGEEGRYYLWRRDQVRRLLSDDEYLVVETLYGLDKPANFEGRWNLHRNDAWRSVVSRLSLDRDAADALLASARQKLLAARQTRIAPARDDKILAGWNGLAIKGLARAARVLGRSEWLEAAQHAADFVRAQLWRDGVLLATWTEGSPRYPAYLDDHAYLMDGLLALLSARWRDEDAQMLLNLGDALLARFQDRDHGGFFFTAHDGEALIHRPKPTVDEALPPGNGIAAQVLARAGHLFGRTDYLDAANRTIVWARSNMEKYPAGHCSLLSALEAEMVGQEQVVIRGPAAELEPWLAAASTGYRPWRQVYAIPYEGAKLIPAYLPKLVSADLRQRTVAYVCRGTSCSLPIESIAALRSTLTG
ncbi:MAG: thioredoxin domain-containing protein [Pseudomonadales bacterium]